MPSVSRQILRLGVLCVCAPLLLGGLAGCTTTQEKADRAQARATHILEARAERQKKRKHDKSKQADKNGNEKKR